MTDAQETNELLREILDVQKAHLMAYQKVSDRALAVQQIAVEQQTQAIRRQRVGAVDSRISGGVGCAHPRWCPLARLDF